MRYLQRHGRAWGVAGMLLLCLASLPTASADTKKFTLINVLMDGTKIWLPSSFIVQQDDDVELTLVNKLEEAHGFQIAAFGIEDVVQPKSQATVRFKATKAGAHAYLCHIHPPHIGGQFLVLSK